MSNRTKWLLGLGVAGVAVAAGLWFFVLGGADDPVTLEQAIDAVTAPAASSGTTIPDSETTIPVTTAGETAPETGIDGMWVVDAELDSFVGYRVQEDLDPIGNNTATGRTRAVTGELIIDSNTVSQVAIQADVSQLASDRSTRDRALRSRGLETSTFPEASFVSTSPFEIGDLPEGQTLVASIPGELTAHGVRQPVVAELEAQLVDGVIAVVGTIDLKLSDFDISGLTGFAVLSVEDEAQVEFQLLFSR